MTRSAKDEREIYEHVVLGTRLQTSAAGQLGGITPCAAGPGGVSLARTPAACRLVSPESGVS